MATFIALKAARDVKATWDVRPTGTAGSAAPPVRLRRGARRHRPGRGHARDGHGRRPEHPGRQAIPDAGGRPGGDRTRPGSRDAAHRGGGHRRDGRHRRRRPAREIADICAAEDLWLHVDAAYGGPAVLAEDLRHFRRHRAGRLDRLRPAQVAVHPALGAAASWSAAPDDWRVLRRDGRYVYEDKERLGPRDRSGMLGPQFSRGFQALKVWVSLLAHGRSAYARRISHDAELARYWASGSRSTPTSNCARRSPCRSAASGTSPRTSPTARREPYLNELNQRLITEMQLDGRAYCRTRSSRGRFVLRACIVNFRTEADDVDATLNVAAELGARLDAELRPSTCSDREPMKACRPGGSGWPNPG